MALYPAMNMGERILFVRKNCGSLSQEEFADKLGLTKSAISGYETGRRIPPDSVLKHIAHIFQLDEDWLKDGVGEPFFPTPDDALDELFFQFECSDFERSFLTAYFYLPDKDRYVFSSYLERIFHAMVGEMKEDEIRTIVSKANASPFISYEDEGSQREKEPAAGTPSSAADAEAEAAYEKEGLSTSNTADERGQLQPEQQKMPTPVSEDGQDDLEEFVRKHKKNLTAGQEQKILEMMQAMIAQQKQPQSVSAPQTVDETSPKKGRLGNP